MPMAREKNGEAYLYILFAGLSFLALLFIYQVIPETKGLTADQLSQMGTGKSGVLAKSLGAMASMGCSPGT